MPTEAIPTDIAPIRPPSDVFRDRQQAAWYRDTAFPPTVSARPRPMVRFLNIEGEFPEVGAGQELVLPIAQGIRANRYGDFALGLITSDDSIAAYYTALAKQHQVPLFISTSVDDFWLNAKPVGDLTKSELDTFDVICKLGGAVTSADLAEEVGLEPAAAANRLASMQRKKYVFRIPRSRKEGDVFQAPNVGPSPWSSSPTEESSPDGNSYIPPEIRDEVQKLSADSGLSPNAIIAAAWRDYMGRHKDRVSEELRRLSEIVKSGDADVLADALLTDVDERARLKAERRSSRLAQE